MYNKLYNCAENDEVVNEFHELLSAKVFDDRMFESFTNNNI